ncbi:hypothetical protein AB6D66_00565 [Vibrio pomeroyi]|uniref:Lipoprotein n=1 Tax=Vibrio pomeroyi TaxID=198832 RepID=A0ABV4MQX0_9VIBR|nr:hypothetical protein [Vibrio atlanticus]MCZ4311042.1 hypothetical protein [Vibrio atlanticus]
MNTKMKMGLLALTTSIMVGCASTAPNPAVVERIDQLSQVCPGCAQSLQFIGEQEEKHCGIPFEVERIEVIAKTSEFYAFSLALRSILPQEKYETVLTVAAEEVDCDQIKWIANTKNHLQEIFVAK